MLSVLYVNWGHHFSQSISGAGQQEKYVVRRFLYIFMVLERRISMVMINGEAREIAGKNLLEYLKENGFNPEQLVVERNFEIISKEQFGSVTIQDEDVIEVLRFVGGG